MIKNIYSRLNLKSINEFEIYLKNYDLKISDIKKKITIDALWNELIIKKYSSKVAINEATIDFGALAEDVMGDKDGDQIS